MVRINKYLSEMGVCSRRKADVLIDNGQVYINNRLATKGSQIDPAVDVVSVEGKKINKGKEDLEYWVLHKPKGYISTTCDEKGRKSVIDLIKSRKRLYPVGRLDADSSGLIILTNDGEFANKLMHPSHNHEKRYLVRAKYFRKNSNGWIKSKFEGGILVEGTNMKAEKVYSIENISPQEIQIDLTLVTGYNRQIRKMCDKIGLGVVSLKRTKIAKLDLNKLALKSGESKQILKEDIL
ncbi:MAG: Ribosomal large subunit pseudouridine synthase B [bacterium ADurb.Bin212]|nr:MAG: Ribosomal large subunit pseudouridine synthase B [bacterium ADurb.Bin212]